MRKLGNYVLFKTEFKDKSDELDEMKDEFDGLRDELDENMDKLNQSHDDFCKLNELENSMS